MQQKISSSDRLIVIIVCLCLIVPAVYADISADIAYFSSRAEKLSRLCEGALREGSYLDKIGRSENLTSVNSNRVAYRFFSLYLKFLSDIERIAGKYQVPLLKVGSTDVDRNYEAYLLGISARLTQIVWISELMNFVERRSKIELLLNEGNQEFQLQKDALRLEVNRVIQVKDLARLYRFRLSDYDRMLKFYQGKMKQKPIFDQNRVLLGLIKSQKYVLNHLLKSTASKPTWKILANTVFDKTLDFILPAQKAIFTWVGDARIKKKETRLVSQSQIKDLEKMLKPGDIILERQDWYLSNLFLPGFWPHGIIYLGDQNEMLDFFKGDKEVEAWCRKNSCKNIIELLKREFPRATEIYLKHNADGHKNVVIEAISDGVVFNSIEHSCKADYLAAVRPNLRKIDIARSIRQAFYYFGREYDFRFSFDSEQTLVCTELVSKAFVRDDGTGLKLPYTVQSTGRYAVTADSIVETFAKEHGQPGAQMSFVAFLMGLPDKNQAVFSDVETFKKSHTWRGGLISSDLAE